MNWIDLVIIAAVGLALWSGLSRGALLQVFSWGGFFAGLIIGSIIAPHIVNAIDPEDVTTKAFLGLGVFLGIAFLFEALVAALGLTVRKKITRIGARRVDQILGGVIGVFFALVGTWFLGSTLKRGPSPTIAGAVKNSAILGAIDDIFPRPPAILAEIGRFLDQSGFPDVFAQLNPSLAPGVEPPPKALANDEEIKKAADSTFKIESVGCGGVVDGSGFPLDDRHVITAAHVVAGTSNHKVTDAEGHTVRATVVFINTDIDIAVLVVQSQPSPVLQWTTRPAGRRADGAAIGYPGGGPRRISPARVRALTDAVGRDIYNKKLVSREVYVLSAVVRQGNSGGPFVDDDGVVRGMIFAASADDPDEAYALSSKEIDRAMDSAKGLSREVDTGSCAL